MMRTRHAVGAAVAAVCIGVGATACLGDESAEAEDPTNAEDPVEVAETFLEAFHDPDIDIEEATQRLAADAMIEDTITAETLEYARMVEVAEGLELLDAACDSGDSGDSAQENVPIPCTVTFHKLASEERGLGPYELTGTVRVANGKVTAWNAGTSYGGGPSTDATFVEEIMVPWWEWQNSTVEPDVMEGLVDTDRALFDASYYGVAPTRSDVEDFVDQVTSLREEYVASVLQDQ